MHSDAEVVLFLGDGLDDADEIAQTDTRRRWLAVRGNCDRSTVFLDAQVKKTDFLTLEGKKIVFTHGDLYGAKYGDGGLLGLAKEAGADIIVFGHTHSPRESYVELEDRGVYLFNPGSVGESFPHGASFGVITLDGDSVLFSHGRIPSGLSSYFK
jgi:putative phosphoesterase